MNDDETRKTHGNELQSRFSGLKGAVHIWNNLILEKLMELMLKEHQRGRYVFTKADLMMVCYVDDISIFANRECNVCKVKHI